ncbi:MAG: alpha/beta fold hydrolase [Rhodocyclaceae bacterium]
MTTIVLLHGWGYDASLWDAVRARLPKHLAVETLEFGYFGAERMKVGAEGASNGGGPAVGGGVATASTAGTAHSIDLAVGHSLGALWWLTQAPNEWRRLLCINGFPRFTETSGYAPAIAPRVLSRMQQQFLRDPSAVLAEFHARCGGHAPAGKPNIERLATGLDALAEWDGRATLAARRADVVALAGTHDPIVPAAMSTMAFGAVEFVDAPGHLLPITHPELCARWIKRLANA